MTKPFHPHRGGNADDLQLFGGDREALAGELRRRRGASRK